MKYLVLSLTCLGLMCSAYAGSSDIYVCQNQSGTKTYANVGDKKGCKKVELPGLTMIPAPISKRGSKAPGDFPKVDNGVQQTRDAERRQILEEELKAEQKKLSDLNAEYKEGQPDRLGNERNYAKYQERTQNLKQNIDRTQQNIDALQREMRGLN